MGDPPNAKLNGWPIIYQLGNIPSNLLDFIWDLFRGVFHQEFIAGNQNRNVINTDKTVPKGYGDIGINLSNYYISMFNCSFCNIHRRTKAAHAIIIRWRNLHQSNINRHATGWKLFGNFREENRYVVSLSFPDGLPNATVYKKTFKAILISQEFNKMGCCPQSKEVVNTRIDNMGGKISQGTNQGLRFSATSTDKNWRPGLYTFHSPLRSHHFIIIFLFPLFQVHELFLPHIKQVLTAPVMLPEVVYQNWLVSTL